MKIFKSRSPWESNPIRENKEVTESITRHKDFLAALAKVTIKPVRHTYLPLNRPLSIEEQIARSPNVLDLQAKRLERQQREQLAQQIGELASRDDGIPEHVIIPEAPAHPNEAIDQGPSAS